LGRGGRSGGTENTGKRRNGGLIGLLHGDEGMKKEIRCLKRVIMTLSLFESVVEEDHGEKICLMQSSLFEGWVFQNKFHCWRVRER